MGSRLIRLSLSLLGMYLGLSLPVRAAAPTSAPASVEQWDIFDLPLPGPADGNPFVDVNLSARFTCNDQTIDATGFYDGGGIYRVRFMPQQQGVWKYETHSNRSELNGLTGQFTSTKPSEKNHGPVRVHNTFHFAYADGTSYFPIGTTCYAWIHQGDALEEQTLKTLADAPFNKIRMCVFPKSYDWNHNEPVYYPFVGTPPNHWDFTRFNPAFFQHMERRIGQLRELGIEADLILFHPYDRGHWGFDSMGAQNDDRYLRYVVARLSAYRNIWWSMANEYDFIPSKRESDWDRLFQIVQHDDPYGHLRSIHNGSMIYDHNKPWVTHASIQNGSAVEDAGRAILYRDVYRKPIVYDEVKYEGNIPSRWGQLSAEEMVFRFWEGTIAGTYVGHGETYLHPEDDVLWWSKGGVLRGQSPARIAFLRKIIETGPANGIEPIDKWQDSNTGGRVGQYYLIYFGKDKPTSWPFELYKTGITDGVRFKVDVIDTWNMTIKAEPDQFVAKKKDNYVFEDADKKVVTLPSQAYMALRIQRVPGPGSGSRRGPG